ncbi:hypothetical protein ACXR2U_20710 [Jatrophihabitans sp. YIM 134969]
MLISLLGGLCACGGASTPAPSVAPTAVPLRPIAACASTVVVPEDSVSTTPAADPPPTVTVAAGQAVSFQVPRAGRVGLLGDASEDDAQLCATTATTTGTAVLVAVGEGYSRIGVQVGIQRPTEVLVRVTPA